MSSVPAISVVMPVYNGEKFLCEAIQSILDQTFKDFELLICDDGSTDGSRGLAKEFARADTRVRLLANQHLGLAGILNAGLREARGEFIARMDADDIALPNRFARQLEFLQHHPDILAVGGQVVVINEAGQPLHVWNMPQEHQIIDDSHICARNVAIIHPTVMMRHSAVMKAGGYRGRIEDIDLWLRLAEQGKLANLPDVVLKYRRISTSYSANSLKSAAEFTNVVKEARLRRGLLLDTLETPVWTRTNGENETKPSSYDIISNRGYAHFALGEKNEALRCAAKMLALRPFSRQSIGFARRILRARAK